MNFLREVALLDHLISFVVLVAAAALFWYIGTLAVRDVLEENEKAASVHPHPVLVEFHPENRNDGLVMVRDGETGALYAIKVESKRK